MHKIKCTLLGTYELSGGHAGLGKKALLGANLRNVSQNIKASFLEDS